MFEKEAENYAIENYETCLYDDLPYASDSRAREQSFKEGAVFGYNKANEWHNLRKHPDDLPKECETVLCYCLGVCGASYPITARLYFDYSDPSIHYWRPSASSGNRPLEELSNVLAWKEIVIPMGIMEESK